jgi:hypothetical protein
MTCEEPCIERSEAQGDEANSSDLMPPSPKGKFSKNIVLVHSYDDARSNLNKFEDSHAPMAFAYALRSGISKRRGEFTNCNLFEGSPLGDGGP